MTFEKHRKSHDFSDNPIYLLHTFDISISQNVMMGTFADDTAILVSHKDPGTVIYILQNNLNEILRWLKNGE